MQRQLGNKRYNTVWNLMHKIRKAIGESDDKHILSGFIELDEYHFEHAVKNDTHLNQIQH